MATPKPKQFNATARTFEAKKPKKSSSGGSGKKSQAWRAYTGSGKSSGGYDSIPF